MAQRPAITSAKPSAILKIRSVTASPFIGSISAGSAILCPKKFSLITAILSPKKLPKTSPHKTVDIPQYWNSLIFCLIEAESLNFLSTSVVAITIKSPYPASENIIPKKR